jgi:hypothetical protein
MRRSHDHLCLSLRLYFSSAVKSDRVSFYPGLAVRCF